MWTKSWGSMPYIWYSLRIFLAPKGLVSSTSQDPPLRTNTACLRDSGYLHSIAAPILGSHTIIGHFQYAGVSTNFTYANNLLASLQRHQTWHMVPSLASLSLSVTLPIATVASPIASHDAKPPWTLQSLKASTTWETLSHCWVDGSNVNRALIYEYSQNINKQMKTVIMK